MQRLLITGATGFIGKHLTREALSRGYEVWAAVRRTSDRSGLEGAHFIELDYSSREALRASMQQALGEQALPPFDYVIHAAGVTKVQRKEQFYEFNTLYTRHLVEVLDEVDWRPRRFVYISSLASYGAPLDSKTPYREDLRQKPTTHYGRSKLQSEHLLEASNLDYSIIAPTGVYGPGDKDYLMAIESISRGWDLMSGLREQRLSFVYVADLVEAILQVMTAPEARRERYIVSDGALYTDLQFGRLVQQIWGRRYVMHLKLPIPLVYLGCLVGDCYGKLTGKVTPLNLDKYHILKQRNWACDISKLKSLGYEPKYPLEEGLKALKKSLDNTSNTFNE